MSKIYLVQTTFASLEEARRVGRALVEARLAACALLAPGAESIYWWEGKVNNAEEVVGQLKTTGDKLPELIAALKERHSYEVPEIVALPVEAGLPQYLDWVRDSTGGAAE
jgi:periplasmic divalent cation tolerance protein